MPEFKYRYISEIINIEKLLEESRKLFRRCLILEIFLIAVCLPFIKTEKKVYIEPKHEEVKAINLKLIEIPSDKNPYLTWKKDIKHREMNRYNFNPKRIELNESNFKNPAQTTSLPDKKIKISEKEIPFQSLIIKDINNRIYNPSGNRFNNLKIEREPEKHLSLKDEMVNIGDIDNLNIYKGFAIQDFSDKKNLKGFIHIPKFIFQINDIKFENSFRLNESLTGLSEALNNETGMVLKVDEPINLFSPDLSNYPLLYISYYSYKTIELTQNQSRILQKYIRNGGFIYIENSKPWDAFSPVKASLLKILADIAGSDGKIEPLFPGDPFFHCFFDIEPGLPEGAEKFTVFEDYRTQDDKFENSKTPDWGNILHKPVVDSLRIAMQKANYPVWCVRIDGDLVAVYSDKGYCHFWKYGIWGNPDGFTGNKRDRDSLNPQLQLGINMVVYALIRQNGVTKKYYTSE